MWRGVKWMDFSFSSFFFDGFELCKKVEKNEGELMAFFVILSIRRKFKEAPGLIKIISSSKNSLFFINS